MIRRILICTAGALALGACGGGENGDNIALTGNDILPMPGNTTATPDLNGMGNSAAAVPTSATDYIRVASASDLFEIESSRLAQERAQNAQVRQFAQMLVNDHTQSTEQLRQAASQAQPALQVAPPQLNPQQQQMIESLRGASGAAFDQLYLQQQLQAHQDALAALQGYMQNSDVPSLRQHASTASRAVEQHLNQVRQLSTQPQ